MLVPKIHLRIVLCNEAKTNKGVIGFGNIKKVYGNPFLLSLILPPQMAKLKGLSSFFRVCQNQK